MELRPYDPETDGGIVTPAPDDFTPTIDRYADENGVPRGLARALFRQESANNPRAVNASTGAAGMGQLMPDTAESLGVTDRFDPEQNISASMKYLREGFDREGTTRGALQYYYGGPDKKQWGRNTVAYPDQVLRHADPSERGKWTWGDKVKPLALRPYDPEKDGPVEEQQPEMKLRPYDPKVDGAFEEPTQEATQPSFDEFSMLRDQAAAAPPEAPKTGSVIDQIPDQGPAPGAPVRPEVRRAIESQLATDANEGLMQEPGWQGQVARQIAPENAARVKMLYDEAIKKGATPEAAQAWAESNAVMPDAASATSTNFDFATSQKYQDANVLTRAAAKTVTTAKQQAGGIVQGAMDLIGADSSRARELNQSYQQALDAMGEGRKGSGYLEQQLESALVSIGTQGPQMLYATLGAPAAATVGLGAMFMQQAGQEYTQGRAQGLSEGDALDRAAFYGTAEVVGEIAGIPAARRFAQGLLSAGVPTKHLMHEFADWLIKEQGGEQLTTALEFGFDKFAPTGLNRDATLEDYLNQVRDTAVQTTMQTLLVGGAGKAAHDLAGTAEGEKAAQAAEDARNAALAKWDAFNKALTASRPESSTTGPETSPVAQQPAEGVSNEPMTLRPATPEEAALVPAPERQAQEQEFAKKAVAPAETMQDAVREAARLSRETKVKHRARLIDGVWHVIKDGENENAGAVESAQPAGPAGDTEGAAAPAASERVGSEAPAQEQAAQGAVHDVSQAAATVDQAAHEAATSPQNDRLELESPGRNGSATKPSRTHAQVSGNATNRPAIGEHGIHGGKIDGELLSRIPTVNPATAQTLAQTATRDTEAARDGFATDALREELQRLIKVPRESASRADALLDQAVADGLAADTHFFGNARDAATIRTQSFDALPIERQTMVQRHVVAALHDPQIAQRVVESVPINVVNVLAGQQLTTERALNDVPMLLDRLSVPLDDTVRARVAPFINAVAASAPRALASAIAEKIGASSEAPIVTEQRGSAVRTENGGAHDVSKGTPESDRDQVWYGYDALAKAKAIDPSLLAVDTIATSFDKLAPEEQKAVADAIAPVRTVQWGDVVDENHVGIEALNDDAFWRKVDDYLEGKNEDRVAARPAEQDQEAVATGTEGRQAPRARENPQAPASGAAERIAAPEGAQDGVAGALPAAAKAANTPAQTPPSKEGGAVSRKRGPNKAERERIAREDHLKDVFTPGNIVKSYGGHDRVLGLNIKPDGQWSARVEEVRKEGGQWVTVGQPREHSTYPKKDAVVERAPDANKPTLFARAKGAPVFVSELARQVEASKTEAASPEQWAATIKNLKGVKADEIEWSGVLDWLKLQSGKVTKAQVSDFLAQNGVKVEETMLGGAADDVAYNEAARKAAEANERQQALARKLESVLPEDVRDEAMNYWAMAAEDPRSLPSERKGANDRISKLALFAKTETMLREWARARLEYADLRDKAADLSQGTSTRYEHYKLRGGEDYRELLLTLPEKHEDNLTAAERDRYLELRAIPERARDESERKEFAGLAQRAEGVQASRTQNFRSSHFDQPNILAHVRFDTRTDAEGRKVLFIEEIQSDWAQKGKREGFGRKESVFEVVNPQGAVDSVKSTRAEAERAIANRRFPNLDNAADWTIRERQYPAGPPAAPFVGKTEAWVALAVKRMIRYAAEHGYDRVAWTTGEQQAERYDLSHHVNRVMAFDRGDGTYDMMVRDVNGRQHDIDKTPKDKLAETVGKELADKIIQQSPKKWTTYEGVDLKIGGEGMRGFYDRIVPNVVNDVLKKIGGGRVERIEVQGTRTVHSIAENADGTFGVYQNTTGGGRALVAGNIKTRERAREVRDEMDAEAGGRTQPGFDVTPEMRARVMQGQPMFARLTRRETPSGLPTYSNHEIGLALPRLNPTQPIDGSQRIAYDILDPQIFKDNLALGRERAAARAKVGTVLVDVKDGKFTTLYNIEMYPTARGKGYGRKAVAGMLQSQTEPILIRDIQPDAVDFWVKMGAKFPRSADYMEARLDQFQYAQKNGPAAFGRDATEGPRGLRAEAPGRGESGTGTGVERRGIEPHARGNGTEAQGLTHERQEAIGQQVVASWANGPDFRAIRTMADAPKAVRALEGAQNARGAEGAPYAFFHDGTIWVITSQINSLEQLVTGIYHEGLGHYGLRGAFGESLAPILSQIMVARRAEVTAKAKEYGLDMGKRADRLVAAEEVLAEMAQTRPEIGFVRRAIAAIRTFLREKLGIKLRMSDDEIVRNFLTPARRFVEEGKGTAPTVAPAVLAREKAPVVATGLQVEYGGQRFAVNSLEDASRKWDQFRREATRQGAGAAEIAPAFVVDGSGQRVGRIAYNGRIFDPNSKALLFDPYNGGLSRPSNEREFPQRSLVQIAERQTVGLLRDADGKLLTFKSRADAVEFAQHEKLPAKFEPQEIRGEWHLSADNNSALFARAKPNDYGERYAKLQSSGRTFSQVASDLFQSDKTFNWWHRSIGTQYHKAQVDPDFKKVYDKAQDHIHEFSTAAIESANMAPTLLPQIDGLRGALKSLVGTASKADIAAVQKPVLDGTLQAPDGNPHEGKVWDDAALKGTYRLTDKQVKLYREYRAAVDHSLDLLLASEVGMLARDEEVPAAIAAARDNPGKAGEIVGDALAKKAENLQKAIGDLIDPKTPGNHGEEAIAKQGEARRLIDLATLLHEKQLNIESLKAHGYAPLMRFGNFPVSAYETDKKGNEHLVYFSLHETQREANAVKREVAKIFPKATVVGGVKSEESYQLYQGLTPDTLELFAQTLGVGENPVFQEYIRVAKNSRSALKRLINRKGTAGFEVDPQRTLAAFITSNARAVAGNWHMGEMTKAVEDIPDRKGDVKDEAVRLVKYLQNPSEGKWSSRMRGFMFIQYLGGSISAAMVNMTQPLTMSYPYLAQWGAKRASTALSVGMAKAVTNAGIPEDLQAALTRGEEEGVVAPHEVHMLHGEAMRSLASNLWARRLLTFWGSFFSAAEAFNRRMTFIAAWDIAKATNQPDPYHFAVRAVEETQGVYSRANRPNWSRGAVGAQIFTFKQYTIGYLEFLKRLPPAQRAQALAILFLLSGSQGLPFAEDIEDIIDTIAQALGYSFNTRQQFRKWATDILGTHGAQFVMHGASHLPGVPLDVQGRLGMGNLIPGTSAAKLSTEDTGKEALDVLGPIGAFTKNVIEGSKDIASGDVKQGLMKMAPVAVQNVMKAVDMWQTGMYRDTKGRKVIDTTKTEAAIKGVGFQPTRVSEDSKLASEKYQNIALHKKVKGDISEKWAEGRFELAIASNDAQRIAAEKKIADAKADLESWNTKNPEDRIKVDPLAIQRRVREMRMDRNERLIRRAPREMRNRMREEAQ